MFLGPIIKYCEDEVDDICWDYDQLDCYSTLEQRVCNGGVATLARIVAEHRRSGGK